MLPPHCNEKKERKKHRISGGQEERGIIIGEDFFYYFYYFCMYGYLSGIFTECKDCSDDQQTTKLLYIAVSGPQKKKKAR